MTFWQIFVRLLPRKPLAALAGLWWHVTGKRVRARNRLRAAGARLPFAYRFWMDKIEPQRESLENAKSALARLTRRPQFAIIVYADGPASEAATARSFQSHVYCAWHPDSDHPARDHFLRSMERT